MARRRGELGLGLDALFEDNTTDIQVKKTLKISEIEPNRTQPRKHFDETAIHALAKSIKVHGVIQPLLVRHSETAFIRLWQVKDAGELQR